VQNETDAEPRTERLSRTGRTIRVAVALIVTGLMIVGNQWGEDDHFPFGPFKMYSSTDPLNQPVPDTRVEAINAEGERFRLTMANTGFRRAEVEGQIPRFRTDPELLESLADAYHRRRPTRPKLVRIDIVIRWWHLDGARATGEYTEETEVTWTADRADR
jgi:hypothetical protein